MKTFELHLIQVSGCTFDLKAGYHHIEIVPCHCTYLGFAWRSDHYVFTVLPFGLSSAPYALIALMKIMLP